MFPFVLYRSSSVEGWLSFIGHGSRFSIVGYRPFGSLPRLLITGVVYGVLTDAALCHSREWNSFGTTWKMGHTGDVAPSSCDVVECSSATRCAKEDHTITDGVRESDAYGIHRHRRHIIKCNGRSTFCPSAFSLDCRPFLR